MGEFKKIRIFVYLDTGEMTGCEGGYNNENVMYCRKCFIRGYCQLRLEHIFLGGKFYEELEEV